RKEMVLQLRMRHACLRNWRQRDQERAGDIMGIRIRLACWALLIGLAGTSAWSGPLAPYMRVVAERDRDFIERSGAQTIEELLDTGIVRYFYTGGQTLLVLVDGRPYCDSDCDLDTLPLSAVERIELLSGEGLGEFGGIAVNGAINVVMRKDVDGFETRAVTRMPSKEGGNSWQGGIFWGGPVGESGGHMTVGVDVLKRQEIPARSREFSRSVWQEGGSFAEASNVSLAGNTVYVVQRDADGKFEGTRTVALGDCDQANGYAGPLRDPPGAEVPGDTGCGFAFGDIMWNTGDLEQRTAIVNLDQPLDDRNKLHLHANFGQGKWAFRYAPSVGTFSFHPTQRVLDEINDAAGSMIADEDDRFAIGHRFVGHGNRDWRSSYDEYDIAAGIEGRLTENLGYEASIGAYRIDASLLGNTFVHADRIREEVAAGNYDLVDPSAPVDPETHRQAIERTSLQEEVDAGGESLGARLALEGQTLARGDRKVAWTAGLKMGTVKVRSILRFRDNEGMTHDVTKVLGSGGVSFEGERKGVGVFGDMSVPLTGRTGFRFAARGDEYDDVGGLQSFRVAAEHRPTDVVTLRSSWGAGDRAPSMQHLHSTASQDHPYIQCDPGPGTPPRSDCPAPNSRQVTRETTGNPQLEPSEVERVSVGAEFRRHPFLVDVEWYRLSRSGLAGLRNPNWAMQNLEECSSGQQSNCIARVGGDITIHDSFANIVDTEISGITTRYQADFETDWGEIGLSGAWRHVLDAELRIEGNEDRYATSRNMARVRFEARRRSLTATWTVNYRAGFRNQADTGDFDDWTGHDVALDWNEPMGLEGARVTAGVFNLTDAGLTVATANPNSVDGPEAAGWGRTFFLTLNKSF
ncbi:MAG: TonB-dependent receptor, partial [Boseongicola sp. SB0670_bin_30]|nr:TonB-dependent receptor [Boseongicola sp. SB0670_bin_30]